MTKQVLFDSLKGAVDKMDPQMIFSLAKDIISSYNNLQEMRIKGEVFIAALKEHEKTVRFAMEKHTEMANQIISALSMLIENASNKEEKMQYLRTLATFGSEALDKLHKTSQIALSSIPKIIDRSEQ